MLPGKLCIGILEEDNPLKSYFRLKPLLVECEGKYVVFDGAQTYPEDGCIRIVPDKNESSHFKGRMRRMGRYCLLDLREHPGENDKIRPNKNYHGDESERNAHIVYSDVVREPAENMIYEILPDDAVEGPWNGEAPGTARLLQGRQVWSYSPAAEEGAYGVLAAEDTGIEEEKFQRFEIEGFGGRVLRFAVRLSDAPVQEPSRTEPVKVLKEPRSAPQSAPAPVQDEKPWISHDFPCAPQQAQGKLTPLQQALAAQSGFNPRRNRSLQEIIEEKWRCSRVEQLGHPVPADAMGHPVENPLDRALEALKNAWAIPELRDRLAAAVAETLEMGEAVDSRRRRMYDHALRQELEEMEAERLRALGDLEKLKRDKRALRETFKQEIRAEEDAELRACMAKTAKARETLKKYETEAEEARKAAEFARDAFEALKDGRFEERLREFALTSRAVELLTRPEEKRMGALPCDEKPSRQEWIARLRRAMEAEGLEIDDVQAANLLVCAALGDSLILSGPASADKCGTARALGAALGAVAAGRYARFSAGHLPADAQEALLADSEIAAVAVVREANRKSGGDLFGCLPGDRENLLVISELADSGFPAAPEALEQGFLLRLEPAASASPWGALRPAGGEFSPVCMQTLRDAFLTDAELPAALESRIHKLREGLALHGVRFSRYTLDSMWRYCAAMLAAVEIPPIDALDYALAQKGLPCILAEAPVECLMELKKLLAGLPRCLALLDAPLPVMI